MNKLELELSETELKALIALCEREAESVDSLSRRLKKSIFWASQLLASLEAKGFAEKKHSKHRVVASLSNLKHALDFKAVTSEMPFVNFSGLLKGGALKVLLAISNGCRTIKEIAAETSLSEITVKRVHRRLLLAGVENKKILSRPGAEESLLWKLCIFARNFNSFLNYKKAKEFSEDAVVVWEKGRKFIARTTTAKRKPLFALTAFDRFMEFGVPLITVKQKYYSYPTKKLGVEDVLSHALVVEKSIRSNLYALLFLDKNLNKINRSKLIKKSMEYGLEERVNALYEFLHSKGAKTIEGFPSWNEFLEKKKEYA